MADSADLLKASFVKIERARKHIKELEEMAAEHIASEPVTYVFDPTPAEGMKTGFQVHFSVRGVPAEMTAVLGDVLHNLRASLDLMASDLARLNAASPDDVYFPFCEDADYLDKMIVKRHFDRAGAAAVKLLKELKPYKGGNAALRAIHDLDIQDKHQMLIPCPMSFASPVLMIRDENGNLLRDEKGQLKPKIVGNPNKPSEVKLVFPAGSAIAGKDLVPTLHDLVETTAAIVERFKALCAPAG